MMKKIEDAEKVADELQVLAKKILRRKNALASSAR